VCCYPGKRMRPDTSRRRPLFRRTYQREKSISVPQPLHFLHPAASASSRFFGCWWERMRRTIGNVNMKQACVLAQSCQHQRQDPCTNRGSKTLIFGRLSVKAKNARSSSKLSPCANKPANSESCLMLLVRAHTRHSSLFHTFGSRFVI
jgi:hypothetical protein